jgi:hypothetical protein
MRSFRAVPRALFATSILGLAMAFVTSASAAVYSAHQALPSQAVQQFLSDPASLLSQFPNGGPVMITKVRDLTASDPATLSALIGLLKSANPDQASAIGTALGQVALMAVNTDQAFATEIQTQIAQAGNTSALVAFSAVVGGDIKLTAAGPGIGIGGGGESQTQTTSGIGGFFAGSPLALPTSVSNTPDSFTLSSFLPGSPGTSSGKSVSPF